MGTVENQCVWCEKSRLLSVCSVEGRWSECKYGQVRQENDGSINGLCLWYRKINGIGKCDCITAQENKGDMVDPCSVG